MGTLKNLKEIKLKFLLTKIVKSTKKFKTLGQLI